MKILNKNNIINSTINENELYNRKEKYNILLNFKNKINDDEKYLKFKKQIFEKASLKIQQKVGMVKNINSKIKKLKNLNKKFLLKKPFISKAFLKDNDENNKENIKVNNKTIDQYKKNNDLNTKNNSFENEKLNRSNKINIDTINIDINNSKRNKTISYKFNEYKQEFEEDYPYFDLSKIKENAQIPKEYLNIIYHNLLKEENKGIVPIPDYQKIISQKEINGQMRSILIDWLIDVHYKFDLTDETLFMTVLIIDRYISYKPISKLRFQLLGITSLLLSCKHEEITLPKIEDFIYITDNAYIKQDVIDMENDILDVLNFDLIFPSPIKFYEYLALNFGFDRKKFLMGKYLMESFMVDINWVKYRASVIACSCIYIVMKYYKMENYKEAYDRKYYNLNENDINDIKYQNELDIKDCAKDICIFVDNVNKSNYLSCKNKYSEENFEKVSMIISGEIP
jgi:cyclin B